MVWYIVLSCLVAFALSAAIILAVSNRCVKVTEKILEFKTLPKEFDGFRIIHISDLHNHRFGKGGAALFSKVRALRPDIIVMTGDLIHSHKIAEALGFAAKAARLCPAYFVSGNHEEAIFECALFKQSLSREGVKVLDCVSERIERDGAHITVMGMPDPLYYGGRDIRERREAFFGNLKKLSEVSDGFKILLSHRPEYFPDYVGKTDLALAGHAHAGQVRIPFKGAIYTPGERFHPRYVVGEYREGDTAMYVSGGLGSSGAVPRVFNRPHLPLLILKKV